MPECRARSFEKNSLRRPVGSRAPESEVVAASPTRGGAVLAFAKKSAHSAAQLAQLVWDLSFFSLVFCQPRTAFQSGIRFRRVRPDAAQIMFELNSGGALRVPCAAVRFAFLRFRMGGPTDRHDGAFERGARDEELARSRQRFARDGRRRARAPRGGLPQGRPRRRGPARGRGGCERVAAAARRAGRPATPGGEVEPVSGERKGVPGEEGQRARGGVRARARAHLRRGEFAGRIAQLASVGAVGEPFRGVQSLGEPERHDRTLETSGGHRARPRGGPEGSGLHQRCDALRARGGRHADVCRRAVRGRGERRAARRWESAPRRPETFPRRSAVRPFDRAGRRETRGGARARRRRERR